VRRCSSRHSFFLIPNARRQCPKRAQSPSISNIEVPAIRPLEPTEGIQPKIVHEIGDIVLRLNQEEKLTVLLVGQKLPFARRVASEFCILVKGRRVAADFLEQFPQWRIQPSYTVSPVRGDIYGPATL
jgi:ABC-type antimicrobial peptide transport system ATPase subunit